MKLPENRRAMKRGAIALVILAVVMFFGIDDWGRDFVGHEAATSADAGDLLLRPLRDTRPADQIAEGVRQAARRISNWEYVGEAEDGGTRLIYFVRTHRLLRLRDDIVMRVEDGDGYRLVSGESRARLHVGDLGRNPRNLRRVMSELRGVLDGAAPARLVVGERR